MVGKKVVMVVGLHWDVCKKPGLQTCPCCLFLLLAYKFLESPLELFYTLKLVRLKNPIPRVIEGLRTGTRAVKEEETKYEEIRIVQN